MKTIYGILRKINRFFAETTGYLVGLIVILLVIDTVGNLIKHQIHGVIELAVFTVIASAYVGLSYTEEVRGHVRVAAIVGRLSPKVQLGINIFWGIVSFIVISLATYAAFSKAVEAYVEGEAIAGIVPYSLSPIRFVIAVSLLFYGFQILANFILDIANFGGPEKTQIDQKS
jgi:TRAP-type mannitol/chloroaromatic compound transport system permease small subunit